MHTKDSATPKERALARKLKAALTHTKLTQKQLAHVTGVPEPTISRLLSGRCSASPRTYTVIAGIVISRLNPGVAERQDLRDNLQYLADEPGNPRWVAFNPEERQLQQHTFHEELKHARSVTAVWPTARPSYFPFPDNGLVEIFAGESIAADRDEADQLGFLAAQGATVHILPGPIIRSHNLDCPFAMLCPNDRRRFVFIDSSVAGAFLHTPADVNPITKLINTLNSTVQPLTRRVTGDGLAAAPDALAPTSSSRLPAP